MDNQDTNLQIPDDIKTFLEGILKDAGMTSLDENMHEEMVKELFVRLDHYMTNVIVENLPSEKVDEFIKMNEEKKPQSEIENYLKQNVPNAQDVLTKAFMNFRTLYLGNVAAERNAPPEKPQETTPDKT